MRNIKLTLEYDGSRYQGWVRLGKDESGNTVSNKLLDVLRKMTDEYSLEIACGCRTEVGVHAYAQVVNFKTHSSMTTRDIKHYLNRYLPMDIAVTKVEEVSSRFHAQLNARSKTYIYRITIDDVPSVFERRYIYHSFKIPEKAPMQEAARLLMGTHDFRHFSSVKKSKSTVKTIYDIEIYSDVEEMQITIHANDFLHNMARILVGTLLEIGLGARKASEIHSIFEGSLAASLPCDPKGLYLQEISYPE